MKLLLSLMFLFSTYAFADDKALMVNALKSNDVLFNTLLGTDQSKVEAAAQALVKDLNKIPAASTFSKLKDSVVHLAAIKKANTKEMNLNHYEKFMPDLVAMVKKNKVDANFEVYYCPMIKKYWVQNKATNPGPKNVFSQDMLECAGKDS